MNEIDERLLFGLYSWHGQNPNYRNWKLPQDPRDGTNQFNHIKDAGEIGKTVIKHLKSKCIVNGDNVEYYKDIKSLSFVPVDNLESHDIKTVQKMINLAYNVKKQSHDEALKKILEREKLVIEIKKNLISEDIEKLKKNIIDLEIEGEIKWKEEEMKLLEEDLIKVKEQLQDQVQIQEQDQLQEGIPWSKLAILQKRSISGYNNELSKKTLDNFAQDHKKLLLLDEEIEEELEEELDVDGYNIKIKKKRLPNRKLSHDEREKIEIQSKRTCEDIHKYDGQKESLKTVHILLEDLLIPNGEKQMILSSIATGKTLKSNDKIIINPWNSKVKWGYFYLGKSNFRKKKSSSMYRDFEIYFML
jgi:hypothetical protein